MKCLYCGLLKEEHSSDQDFDMCLEMYEEGVALLYAQSLDDPGELTSAGYGACDNGFMP